VVVCSCRVVSDRAVVAAIDEGASTVEDLVARCQAGGRCGGCWPALQRLLEAGRPAGAGHVAA
jgi:NAD(P)H-nitrite reductase large subunit